MIAKSMKYLKNRVEDHYLENCTVFFMEIWKEPTLMKKQTLYVGWKVYHHGDVKVPCSDMCAHLKSQQGFFFFFASN